MNTFIFPETTRHKRHHIINSNHKEYAKKITHPDFPKGGYLLVHHPYSQLVTSSSQSLHAHNHHHSSSTENIKPTQNSHNHQNYLSNEIDAPRHKKHKKHNQDHFTNEILIRDMESLSGHNSENIKNKYDLRFKRHNQHNAISLDHCCNTNCDWLLCSDDFDE